MKKEEFIFWVWFLEERGFGFLLVDFGFICSCFLGLSGIGCGRVGEVTR